MFDLQHNQLTAFPPIEKLSRLRTLDLQFNLITEIPGSIGALSTLTGLHLKNNQIASVRYLWISYHSHKLTRLSALGSATDWRPS